MKSVFAAVLALLFVALAGCNDNSRLPGETGDEIGQAQNTVVTQSTTLGQLKSTVDEITPSNANTVKPKAQQLTADAQSQNKQIASDLGVAAKSAQKDAKQIKSLSDPVVVRLNEFGYTASVLGILAAVAGIFFSTYLGSFAAIARNGGIAAIVTGVATVFLAAYLHTLFWIIGGLLGVGLLGGIVWLVLHRTQIIPAVESFFNRAKATVTAGVATTVK